MDIKQLLAGLNILLIDDEALGIDSVLGRLGARVVICSSVEQAQTYLGVSGRNADDIRRTLPPDKPDLYAAYLVKSIGPLQIGREIARIMSERRAADAPDSPV